IGFAVGNTASTLLLGLSFGLMGRVPGTALTRPYFRALNRIAAAFAMLADLSMMLLGGELKRRERLSARLGDVLSQLYLASAALKRFHDLGQPAEQEPLLRWALEDCLAQAEEALKNLLVNFPNRALGCVLYALVFPFGTRHKGPSDALDAEVAALLGRPEGDPALERILDGMYRPQDPQQPLGALQRAFEVLAASQDAAKKLAKALKAGTIMPQADGHPIAVALAAGVIDEAEAQRLQTAEEARRKVIDVDDFAKEELQLQDGKIR
ncbi:acyl-CoA dehydrogenase domain-containing protein, partial [Pseudomonas sp.]|uniref:acyl-CoA dehydrogenase domain-containing protein n=1 Tax=Pseudomonas sp. TaxID=306 RepID=UPI003D09D957